MLPILNNLTDILAKSFKTKKDSPYADLDDSTRQQIAALFQQYIDGAKEGSVRDKDKHGQMWANHFSSLSKFYGPHEILPLILKNDCLSLLVRVAETCTPGVYGTVLIKKENNKLYVGEYRFFSTPDGRSVQRVHGQGGILTDNYRYFGHLTADKPSGEGAYFYLKLMQKNIGISRIDSFEGRLEDRRGDVCTINLQRYISPAICGGFTYRYASGEVAVGSWTRNNTRALCGTLDVDATADSFSMPSAYEAFNVYFERLDDNDLLRWRSDNIVLLQRDCSANAAHRSILQWQPDSAAVRMLREIQTQYKNSQEEVSPSTLNFLEDMLLFQGPATPYIARYNNKFSVVIYPWGENKNLAQFIARSMPLVGLFKPGATLELKLTSPTKDSTFLFHPDNYENPRQMFLGQMQQYLDGLTLAFTADEQAQDKQLSRCNQILKESLARGPCTDGRTQSLVDSLVEMDLIDSAPVRIVDTSSKDPLRLSDAHLEAFRHDAIARFCQKHGANPKDTASIEANPLFVEEFFNIELFMAHLGQQDSFINADSAMLAKVRTYQLDEIGVLGHSSR